MTSARSHASLGGANRRLANRTDDILLVQRTSRMITELGLELDRKLAKERRPSERLRMLRETTNRITRAANDAVHAYQRTSRALRAELERPDGDGDTANAVRVRLEAARSEVLEALDAARAKYLDPESAPPAG